MREVITVLAKISNSATAMACAACIATAATLPVMGTAAEQAEKLAKTVDVKLSALSDIDAFSALGAPFIGTDAFSALGAPFIGTDAFSALTVFQAVLSGDIDALAPSDTSLGYAALSAVPSYLTGQLTDIDAFSALGAPFIGTDAFSALGAPLIGTDAVSAVPNYVSFFTTGDLSTETGLGGIDAFSAVPAYLGIDPPVTAADIPAPTTMATATLAQRSGSTSKTPTTGSNSLGAVPAAISALVAKPNAAPAPAPQAAPQVEQQAITPATVTDNSGEDSQHVTRNSEKFTPESIGDSPLLFGSSKPGGEGMRGYGSFLKKLGISGGEESSSGTG